MHLIILKYTIVLFMVLSALGNTPALAVDCKGTWKLSMWLNDIRGRNVTNNMYRACDIYNSFYLESNGYDKPLAYRKKGVGAYATRQIFKEYEFVGETRNCRFSILKIYRYQRDRHGKILRDREGIAIKDSIEITPDSFDEFPTVTGKWNAPRPGCNGGWKAIPCDPGQKANARLTRCG